MPDLIGDDLVVGALLDKADSLRLLPLVHRIQWLSFKKNGAAPASMGCKHRFQLPQQRGFSAAGGTTEHQKLSSPDRQSQMLQNSPRLFRIGKTKVFDYNGICHGSLSFFWSSAC